MNTKENLRFWKQLETPPKAALKEIKFGALKGKSDINPQWRMEAMTEVFGPVGFGWKYEVAKKWTVDISDGQVCAFVDVLVYIKDGDEWSAPIPGTGGSMLVDKNKHGLCPSDEAFKMATTDALSVSLKAIGVAADVYKGCLDGSKYDKRQPEVSPAERKDTIKQQLQKAGSEKEVLAIQTETMDERKVWPVAWQRGMEQLIDSRLAEFNAAE